MKFKLFLLSLMTFFALSCSAQFFKPLPKPGHVAAGKFGLAADSIQNNIRPVVGVTATIQSSGTQLAGGFGIGLQHNKWDAPSQTWVTQYSVSALAFLGGNGSSADVTAGVVVGFLSFISIGGGYDFTTKKVVLLTGVQLHFN